MTKPYLVCAMALLSAVTLTLRGQNNPGNSGSWSGVVINSTCSVDEAFAEAAKCTASSASGGKLVLYDDTIRQIYNLHPPTTSSLGDAAKDPGKLAAK